MSPCVLTPAALLLGSGHSGLMSSTRCRLQLLSKGLPASLAARQGCNNTAGRVPLQGPPPYHLLKIGERSLKPAAAAERPNSRADPINEKQKPSRSPDSGRRPYEAALTAPAAPSVSQRSAKQAIRETLVPHVVCLNIVEKCYNEPGCIRRAVRTPGRFLVFAVRTPRCAVRSSHPVAWYARTPECLRCVPARTRRPI